MIVKKKRKKKYSSLINIAIHNELIDQRTIRIIQVSLHLIE